MHVNATCLKLYWISPWKLWQTIILRETKHLQSDFNCSIFLNNPHGANNFYLLLQFENHKALVYQQVNLFFCTNILEEEQSHCKCPIKLQNQMQPGVAKVITLILHLWRRILVCHIKGNTISSRIRIYDFFTSQ